MSNQLITFDPNAVFASFAGIDLSTFCDGDAIKITREDQVYTKKPGVSGDIARSKSANKSASIVLRIWASAPECVPLLQLFNAGSVFNPLGDVAPFQLLDTNTGITWFAPRAWPAKLPDHVHNKEAAAYEFTIDCDVIEPLTA